MTDAALPVLDLRRQYAALSSEIAAAVTGVFESGVFINGPNVAEFEREFAVYVGTEFAVGLNSGTDALHLALRALDIGPGDEVVTTPFTFAATTEAIGMVGARPVFADIDPRTYALDPQAGKRPSRRARKRSFRCTSTGCPRTPVRWPPSRGARV